MPYNWATVTALFHQALEQPADRRDAWLDGACLGDSALRDEVRSLLAAHEDVTPRATGPTAAEADRELWIASMAPIGPYRLIRAIGAGGMGIVYLAEDTRLKRLVALKALADEWTHDDSRRERLRREARAAAALSHPGIATVFALEEFDGALYLVSEYVPGETLREELARGPLAAGRVLDTGLALAQALAVAHAHGIVHRDVKPENIVRTSDGGVKLVDFGLAYDMDAGGRGDRQARLTRDGAVLGTPAYMAPEQIRYTAIDARADVFSLGVVLYEMVTGESPFADQTPAATIGRVLEREPAPVDGPLGPVIRRCLAKRPDDRFASAAALADALVDVRAGRVQPAPLSVSPPNAVQRWWEFHQGATAVVYLLLLVPLWFAHEAFAPPYGLALFLTGLAAVLTATSLRLHLWFTVRWYPAERHAQAHRAHLWLRLSDVLFVLTMVAMVAATMSAHSRLAVILVAAAVTVLVSFAIVEPATSRAAFPER
jgi:hypothetical protein